VNEVNLLRIKEMKRAQSVLIFVLTLWVVPLQARAGQEDELRKRISEFEARLQKLEQATQPPGKNPPTAEPQSGGTAEIQELRRQLEVIAQEVEKLRSGEPEIEITDRKAKNLGLGSSAASVYRKRQGVSIAGYGEMTYENSADRNESGNAVREGSRLDFLRAVLYTGYRFNEKFVFNSEIEFEHASTGKTGEVAVEFAYIDYLAHKNLALRGGLLLVPMGLTNEFHEPNAYLGVRRSATESLIIPSTWAENGFGVVGSAGPLQYRAYVVNGMDAGGFSSDGLREGRQEGSETKATNLAFVGRLDIVPVPGVLFGGALYTGGSGQGQFIEQGRDLKVTTTIGEAHAQIQARGVDLRGLYARASVGDVAALNQARNLTGGSAVGGIMQGGYVQAGYNVLSQYTESIRLTPYYRFERVNTQKEVPLGFASDPATDRKFHTLGLEFRPVQGVVLKSDYQWLKNGARTGLNQFNISLGYAF